MLMIIRAYQIGRPASADGRQLDVRERLVTIEGGQTALKNETRCPVHNKLSAHDTASTIFDFDQS